MINKKKILAIIPARGGSKRLPRKNVLSLGGKPLIAWSIEAGIQSDYIDKVVVSTEDDEIAAVARKYGAEVPFMRSVDLATDEAASIDVVLEVISRLENDNKYYDLVVLLQPTSPLRLAEDIDNAVEQLERRNDSAVVSLCKAEHSPLWTNTLSEDGSMSGFISEDLMNSRSQDLVDYYRLNGAIYVLSIEVLRSMEKPSFFPKEKISAYVMPQERSVDIDSKMDFMQAQLVLETAL